VRPSVARVGENRASQVRGVEDSPVKDCASQVRADEAGTSQVRADQVRLSEIRAEEIRVTEVRA
jgi:hypothetical protein